MTTNPPLTPAERQTLIARIRDLPGQLEALVAGLSAEQLATKYLEGEWCVAQDVHHIADAHLNAVLRMKLILTEDEPPLKPFDQDRWAALADSRTTDLTGSLAIIRGLHSRWAELLASLSDSDFRRIGHHPERGPLTIDDLLRIYSGHGQAHLAQIRKTLPAGSAG